MFNIIEKLKFTEPKGLLTTLCILLGSLTFSYGMIFPELPFVLITPYDALNLSVLGLPLSTFLTLLMIEAYCSRKEKPKKKQPRFFIVSHPNRTEIIVCIIFGVLSFGNLYLTLYYGEHFWLNLDNFFLFLSIILLINAYYVYKQKIEIKFTKILFIMLSIAFTLGFYCKLFQAGSRVIVTLNDNSEIVGELTLNLDRGCAIQISPDEYHFILWSNIKQCTFLTRGKAKEKIKKLMQLANNEK